MDSAYRWWLIFQQSNTINHALPSRKSETVSKWLDHIDNYNVPLIVKSTLDALLHFFLSYPIL